MPNRKPKHRELSAVLVPTDFSEGAGHALERALLLPLAPGASVQLLHVLPERASAAMRARAEELLATLAEQVAAERSLEVSTEVRPGEPHVEIIRSSRELEAELVVLGRHGRRAVRDLFIGSTAQRVARKGDVPLLMVNQKPTRPYQRPLIATDLGDTTPQLFALAATVLGPEVKLRHVVHAYNVPFEGFMAPTSAARRDSDYRRSFRDEAIRKLDAQLARHGAGLAWKKAVQPGDARTVILERVVRWSNDLVVMGTHGRGGVAHSLVGSVAEWVLSAAVCDVLVSRPARFTYEAP